MSSRNGRHQGLERILRAAATPYVELVQAKLGGIATVVVAGSYRRKRETVGDLDFVVVPTETTIEGLWQACREAFGEPVLGGKVKERPRANRVDVDRKGQWILDGKVTLDIYVAELGHFEPMLLYLTGSASYNKMMRWTARRQGLILSQYGLRDAETKQLVGEQTEEGIHQTLGLEYKQPEERNGFG